jgi:hypothetical protein
MRSLLALLIAVSAAAWADGPGTRIRAGSGVLQPPQPQTKRCEGLRGEARDKCMKDARKITAADERTRGPGSVGGSK